MSKENIQWINRFIDEYILTKVTASVLADIDNEDNKVKIVDAIIESFQELDIDMSDIEVQQTIENMLNSESLKKLKKKYKYEPAEIDMLPDKFKNTKDAESDEINIDSDEEETE